MFLETKNGGKMVLYFLEFQTAINPRIGSVIKMRHPSRNLYHLLKSDGSSTNYHLLLFILSSKFEKKIIEEKRTLTVK